MGVTRMAKSPAVYALFCSVVLAQAVCASPHLPDGISDFVPDCAARCFRSFLDVNYQGTRCGSRGSLRCFCTTQGNTGFTLGEGALQCIAVEGRFGGCSQYAARQAKIDEAYYICSDQPGAVNPTHEVITASLLLPTSSGDAVLFPPLTTTTTAEPERPTSLPTTLLTDTSAFPEPVPSSTEPTTTRTVPTTLESSIRTTDDAVPTETGTGAAPLPAPTEGDEDSASGDDNGDDDEPPTLGTAQVAGISVGVVAAAGVAIGAIFLARYFRRRKNPSIKTGFLPRRSTWGYNLNWGSSTTVSDHNPLVMTRTQIPEPGTVPPPPAYGRTTYSRASWKPEAIGLALSPGQQKKDAAGPISPACRLSKLLPAKPVMSPFFGRRDLPRGEDANRESGPAEQRRNDAPPQLPPFVGLSVQQPADNSLEKPCPPSPLRIQIPKDSAKSTTAPANGIRARESTMTEFEEDDGPSSLSPQGQIWRPPSSTPFAASPYYVADKNGNWVLADSSKAVVAELPATTPPPPEPKSAPASKPKNLASFLTGSKSVSGPHGSVTQRGSTPRPSQTPAVIITPTHGSPSSLYSPPSSAPLPLFHPSSADQRSSGPSRTPTYLGRSDNRTSSESSGVTLFENSSDESKEPTPPEMSGSLSPVAESPPSAKGRSPVEYPQIAGRGRNNSVVTRPNQPPPTRSPVYYPPGQPSPTLGMLSQQNRPLAGMSSYNVPTKGRQPVEHPAMAPTGSPTTIRVVEPSSEPDDRGRLPSWRTRYSQASSQPPYQPHVQPSPYQRQSQIQQQPPRPPQQRQGPPPHAFYIRGHYPPTGPSVYSQEHQLPPQTTYDNGPYPHTGPSPYRGENQMPLPPGPSNRPKPQRFPHHPPEHAGPVQQQPRLDTMSIPLLLPSSANHHPSPVSEASTSSSLLAKRLGSDRAAQMALTEPGGSSSAKWRREGPPGQQQDLPSTPGWRPKLTPTRRGDDLFLNVQ